MLRQGFVSNSSSTSFVIALRKGADLDSIIQRAGVFSGFAQYVATLVQKASPLESIQNVTLAVAQREDGEYVSPEGILASIKFGEWDYVEKFCREAVENPDEWFFGYGDEDYNTVIGEYLSNGMQIDSDTFKLKRAQ